MSNSSQYQANMTRLNYYMGLNQQSADRQIAMINANAQMRIAALQNQADIISTSINAVAGAFQTGVTNYFQNQLQQQRIDMEARRTQQDFQLRWAQEQRATALNDLQVAAAEREAAGATLLGQLAAPMTALTIGMQSRAPLETLAPQVQQIESLISNNPKGVNAQVLQTVQGTLNSWGSHASFTNPESGATMTADQVLRAVQDPTDPNFTFAYSTVMQDSRFGSVARNYATSSLARALAPTSGLTPARQASIKAADDYTQLRIGLSGHEGALAALNQAEAQARTVYQAEPATLPVALNAVRRQFAEQYNLPYFGAGESGGTGSRKAGALTPATPAELRAAAPADPAAFALRTPQSVLGSHLPPPTYREVAASPMSPARSPVALPATPQEMDLAYQATAREYAGAALTAMTTRSQGPEVIQPLVAGLRTTIAEWQAKARARGEDEGGRIVSTASILSPASVSLLLNAARGNQAYAAVVSPLEELQRLVSNPAAGLPSIVPPSNPPAANAAGGLASLATGRVTSRATP